MRACWADFRQVYPFHPSFPQWFKQHNYTTLGHSKLFHWGHPERNDEPLSWSQEQPYVSQEGVPGVNPEGCGYFDVCPGVAENSTIDYVMVEQALHTLRATVAALVERVATLEKYVGK